MKRNIYTRQEAFWCIVRSRTPFRFGVMADEEKERKKERKKEEEEEEQNRYFCGPILRLLRRLARLWE